MTEEKPPRRAVRNMFGSSAELQICPSGSDPLAMMAFRAEAECERLGWGGEREAPLRWFWLHDQGPLLDQMRSVAMGPADMSEALQSLHPLELLQTVEEHMTDVDRDLVGFVLVAEAWTVTYAGGDRAGRERAMAAAERREIWRQPDRKENRIAELQMLTGQRRTVLRVRGEEPVLVGSPAGDVPAALRKLAVTLRRRKYGRRG